MVALYSGFITFISFVIVFGIIVFVHELGHFAVAKWNNVKVDEFAMGMGKRLWSVKRGETTYALNLLPIGGYVKLDGEDIASNDPRSLSNAKPFAQFQILIAGATMNFVLGIVAFAILFFNIGVPVNKIGELVENLPAVKAGVMVGDEIISVNGKPTGSWDKITEQLRASDKVVDIKILRKSNGASETLNISVPLEIDKASGKKVIGIRPAYEKNIPQSFNYALKQTWMVSTMILDFFRRIPTDGVQSDNVMGPVGMASIIGDAAKSSINDLISLTAMLSINLGIFNLLPFPALDGGRLIFVIIEMITGKRPKKEHEGWVHGIGMLLLLGLMVLVVFNDLFRIFGAK